MLAFEHFPAFELFEQLHFDFFGSGLQQGGFFVIFENVGVGKLRVQIGLLGFERGQFVGQAFELALLFIGKLHGAVGFGLGFFRRGGLGLGRGGGFFFAAFGVDIVLVAADVFFQTAFAFKHNALGDDVVEKHTVVAYQKYGARIIAQ